ncbi:MAG: carbonic anhydrase [Firmicutes bacterium]|nr:carbonic anhydrase [Bacillota bacterium]
MMKQIIEYNKNFAEEGRGSHYTTSKYPDRNLAIVTCMDTRLTEMLPAALGIKNGDAKIIKDAGGMIVHPFGSVVRSLLIAIYELGVEHIMIIGHTDCGVQHMEVDEITEKMRQEGIEDEVFHQMRYYGIDFDQWMGGFDCVETAVHESVELLEHHPLIPKKVSIYGFIIDTETGLLRQVAGKKVE